ncbi:hypothetical protein [Metabacillus halosaccharovorans]|uniref:IDEAL domain-containing protein n=1 Tax=Metabacillus halosaccharovorans TaxID=930124 RepID=A0ABT3DJB8_9BACI|nr:hypothetical protein [Metabacillus halosaccharovorans]MCV9886752.1 hypothetical protein [Metabacillus halosaccharovorans]
MHHYFIVNQQFQHFVECFCPDGEHEDMLTIKRGELLEVTNERTYVYDQGWYNMVILNSDKYIYMALDDLEKYFIKGYIYSLMDLELHINHLKFQVDQSLGNGNEDTFLEATNGLKKSNELKIMLERHLNSMTENQLM